MFSGNRGEEGRRQEAGGRRQKEQIMALFGSPEGEFSGNLKPLLPSVGAARRRHCGSS
ncbi:hypothetical protein [Nostoc sp. UHCC 0251]|uniref:hypothetical protein n=1 Tax=Nostoc sp. UHCC 0251 TaxID=3110240 RepID=UPI002B200A33|nr:hypothetical protein [Nostoc sp. UHCC 0251]MEA5626072.1 hypothetical protein [Nostoc sp. UHCC 0251]